MAATWAMFLLLTGCCCAPTENPEVAAKCTPVRDLLQKNFREGAGANVLGNGFDEYYERSGVVLDKEETTRLAEIDFACRSWAAHNMPGDQYNQVLAMLFGGSVSVVTDGNPSEAFLSKLSAEIERLQKAGEIPPGPVAAEATQTARLPPEQAVAAMDTAAATTAKYSGGLPAGTAFQTEMLARLAALETAASRFAYPPPSEVPVSFATNSIEIPEIYYRLLRRAAASWQRNGITVSVVGYADARGNRADNQRLSQRRAEAVAAVLRRYGVGVSSVTGRGVAADLTTDYGMDRIVVIKPVSSTPAS
jgi:outer membrane protein OmpA-like peptidoglycan-associated protein